MDTAHPLIASGRATVIDRGGLLGTERAACHLIHPAALILERNPVDARRLLAADKAGVIPALRQAVHSDRAVREPQALPARRHRQRAAHQAGAPQPTVVHLNRGTPAAADEALAIHAGNRIADARVPITAVEVEVVDKVSESGRRSGIPRTGGFRTTESSARAAPRGSSRSLRSPGPHACRPSYPSPRKPPARGSSSDARNVAPGHQPQPRPAV